jgi:hypothetical protein
MRIRNGYHDCLLLGSRDAELVRCVMGLSISFQNTAVPEQLLSGLWNCSSPEWPRFKPHLRCNLVVECEEGEDEVGCWHTGATCGLS